MRASRRGIVLLTALLVTGAVVVSAGSGCLVRARALSEGEAALLAADSGLQYAMARLQEDPDWRGDGADQATSRFRILEDRGNVLGFLTTPSGEASQFRIKFNCQDGPGGQDGLADSSRVLRTPFVSVNNLRGAGARPLLRANEDGVGVAAPSAPPSQVPGGTACIVVEGLAGGGLREANQGDPFQAVGGRGVTRRVVEAYLTLDVPAPRSGGSPEAGLPRDEDGWPPPRTWNDVELQGRVVFEGRDAVGTSEGTAFTLNHAAPDEDAKPLDRLDWDSLPKAGGGDSTMPGGTYVWRLDSRGPYLEYFDVELAPGEGLPEAGTGRRIDTNNVTRSGDGVAVDPGSLALTISKDVLVEASEGGATGLSIRTDPEITAAARRPMVAFAPPAGSGRPPVLTAAGSVCFEGALLGSGSITSEQEIRFQGPSVLEADPQTGVSLYARGDISVEAIPEPVAQLQGAVADYVESELMAGRGLPTTAQIRDYLHSEAGQQVLDGMAATLAGRRPDETWVYGLRPAGEGADQARKAERLERILAKFGRLDAADQSVGGAIHTWKDFHANLGGRGLVHVTGTLVAQGGAPAGTGAREGDPRGRSGGDGGVSGASSLQDLLDGAGALRLRRTLWRTD